VVCFIYSDLLPCASSSDHSLPQSPPDRSAVTLSENSDNSLLGTLGNGANNFLLDTPQYLPGHLQINTNGRNGQPAFNTALFPEENLGQLGNAKRRIFGSGANNFGGAG
jgi:hypothetical protein